MAEYGAELPEGFTLDEPKNYGAELPEGFTLDETPVSTGSEVDTFLSEQPVIEPNGKNGPMSVAALNKEQVLPGEGGKPMPKQSGVLDQAGETFKNIGEVYPVAETAANLVTSSYGVPLSGLAGLFALPFGVDKAKDVVESTQKALVYEPQTESGKELSGAVAYPFEKLDEVAGMAGGAIEEAGFPDLAAAVHTAILSAPSVLGAKKSIGGGVKALDAKTRLMVKRGINKAIRPSVVGKDTASKTKSYYKKATEAVEEIIKNKDNLDIRDETGAKSTGLPKTLDEFSQAVEQTKRNVFTEYDSLAKQADGKGAIQINLDKTANNLNPVTNNKVLKDLSPETIEYAQKRIKSLSGREKYTALETQDAIQVLNQTLEKFYRDPSPAMKGQALVDSLIANDLRIQLNDAITKSTGKEYQNLKRKYGALKTIEKDVNRRAIVDSRKNNKGLLDFSDVFTGGHVISGMLRKDPSVAAAGIAGKGLASYYKMLNDPNKIVKTMFADVEKLGRQGKKTKVPAVATIAGTAMEETGAND